MSAGGERVHQARAEVAAAAVNPPDLTLAAGVSDGIGLSTSAPTPALGSDFGGTFTATGPDAALPVGSRVTGLVVGFDRRCVLQP